MGTTDSKNPHRYRSNKHLRYKNPPLIVHHCHHQNNQVDLSMTGKKESLKRKNETIVPLLASSPLNPPLQGSILNHSFPLQRAHSDVHMMPSEVTHQSMTLNPLVYSSDSSQAVYDYQKDMQRVDEENRPVLEGLCPEKMYVSTNDLRICDTQRLPPPLRCKMMQGFFRPVPPPHLQQRKPPRPSSFL